MFMVRTLPLTRNIGWTFVGNVVYSASQWGALAALAKLGSAAALGEFALSVAITGPIFALASLNLRVVQASDVHQETGLDVYMGLRLITLVAALAIVISIALLFMGGRREAAVVVVYGVAKVFEGISDCVYGYLHRWEQMKSIALSLMTRGTASLAILASSVSATGSALAATLSYAITWGLCMVLIDLTLVRRLKRTQGQAQAHRNRLIPSFHMAQIRSLFTFSLPLGVIIFFNVLSTIFRNILLRDGRAKRN
jgi:O-antigen/teichoic acid export membrane protein